MQMDLRMRRILGKSEIEVDIMRNIPKPSNPLYLVPLIGTAANSLPAHP